MAEINTPVLFTVVARNSEGNIVPDTGITVSVDLGTATVDPDGNNGTWSSPTSGVGTIISTDGKLTAPPVQITFQNTVPTSLETVIDPSAVSLQTVIKK